MDPNAALAEIRDLANAVTQDHPTDDAASLAERIEDLDEWLARGGFLPHAWAPGSVAVPAPLLDVLKEAFADAIDDTDGLTDGRHERFRAALAQLADLADTGTDTTRENPHG